MYNSCISMAAKSKILIIGGTGYIGKFMVEASAKSGHQTFVLVRQSTASDPAKANLLDSFKNFGATLVYGDLYDHESLVKAIKQVDVVMSTIFQIADQVKIIAAIKEAGNVKVGSRFGESTLKLSSMLTDGQVGRLKDRSAAAMSTFGDILPVQAAGLLSSFTAGRSDL